MSQRATLRDLNTGLKGASFLSSQGPGVPPRPFGIPQPEARSPLSIVAHIWVIPGSILALLVF